MAYTLLLKKENFKFSSSHFTIFSKSTAEHLHGHNYQVSIKVLFEKINTETEMAVDFNLIKKEVRQICEQMDEKILLPKKSKFLNIIESPHYKNHTEVHFNERRYCFPNNEIYYIEANNVTSEALARVIYKKLEKHIKGSRFSVTIFETAGQAAQYSEEN
ncbi:6-carboxytetrahydropterin synthase [bacterium]|nr:6-carboxytetrahydropterin synthase [bacterium]